MKTSRITRGLPALDLLEQAAHVLRQAPPRLILAYYLGAVPFVLALLNFWADMSCGAFARRHCAVSALGVALLFLWMKFWQSVFAAGLRAGLSAQPPQKWTLRRAARVFLAQAVFQPSKLFILPVAMIATLPFAWVVAFYENLTALGSADDAELMPLMRRAAAQAKLWPGQNHLLAGIFSVLAVAVWLNTAIAIVALPQLLKMLLGIETGFTRGGLWSVLNTTFLAATVAVAGLALDPLVKTAYALRCFHGEARRDGADLLADLAGVRRNGNNLAVAIAIVLTILPLAARAGEAVEKPASASASQVSSTELDQAVKSTLAQEKYAWRLPREAVPENEGVAKSWLRGLIDGMLETLAKWARACRDEIRSLLEWIQKFFRPRNEPKADSGGSGTNWMLMLRGFAYVLLALAAAVLGILLWRMGRQGWRRQMVVVAEALPASPDLTDENVTAAQLPEDGWLQLARELMEKGELRLALRALYLASLAHLASREVISLARFKSNCDYQREVGRRARGLPELQSAFSENVALFDRALYGFHEVTGEALQQFQGNLERIRAC